MFAGVLPQPPAPGTSQNSGPISQEAHYLSRIRELEEEIRLSRIENEKNVSSFHSPTLVLSWSNATTLTRHPNSD
jgi:hypothetical protein